MKNSILISTLGLAVILSACSKVPSECQTTWKHIEKIAKSSGIPKEAIENQKKAFEQQISQLPKDEAQKNCKAQNDLLGSAKQ